MPQRRRAGRTTTTKTTRLLLLMLILATTSRIAKNHQSHLVRSFQYSSLLTKSSSSAATTRRILQRSLTSQLRTRQEQPERTFRQERAFFSTISSEMNDNTATAADSATTATTSTTTTSTMEPEPQQQPEYPIEMTEAERYLFDLNGYIVIRNVLTPDQVQQANDAIDQHAAEFVPRNDPALRNAVQGTPLYGTGPGRLDLGRVLEWPGSQSQVFKSILAHPRLVPLFHGILGEGYHMDHLPFVLAQDEGGEGFQLHGGTVDCKTGQYNPHLAYTCHHNMIRSALLGCNVMLTDHNPGDGGFCIVPGSHKANFKMPPGMVDGTQHAEFIVQPATKAGDVVLFSEGTVHGAMAWQPQSRQRRCCLYRFAPATNVYGRSYFGSHGNDGNDDSDNQSMGWPAAIYQDLTDAQRAVLEPPYANRLDRPNIQPDGSVTITTRNERKKQHDREVFGTKYF